MSWFTSSSSHSTTATSHANGFMDSLGHWLNSLLQIVGSVFHSIIAFFEFVFAISSDILWASYRVTAHFLQVVFSAANSAFTTTTHVFSHLTKAILSLFGGVIGFVAGNFLAISLVLGAFYFYSAYQKQNQSPEARDKPVTEKAAQAITDAARLAQSDAERFGGKASEKVKGAWEAGQAYTEKINNETRGKADDLTAAAANARPKRGVAAKN